MGRPECGAWWGQVLPEESEELGKDHQVRSNKGVPKCLNLTPRAAGAIEGLEAGEWWLVLCLGAPSVAECGGAWRDRMRGRGTC